MMKHIEVEYHFIREVIMQHRVVAYFISFTCRFGGISTKALSSKSFSHLWSKLGM